MGDPARLVNLLENIDVDNIRIERDSYFPGAYIIDLPLDSTPGHIWQDIFSREWKLSKHLWDRKLFLMGDKLRLLTSPEDVKEKIDWVKDVLKRTNAGVEEHNRRLKVVEAEASKEAQKTLEEDQANTEMIRDTLRRHIRTV